MPKIAEVREEAERAAKFAVEKQLFPSRYALRNIIVSRKLKSGNIAECQPYEGEDGGDCYDILLSTRSLSGNWKEKVWGRVFHEMVEATIYDYVDAVGKSMNIEDMENCYDKNLDNLQQSICGVAERFSTICMNVKS
jgi:hypothetical protein